MTVYRRPPPTIHASSHLRTTMTNIFAAVKPMLLVTKCLGLGPFYVDEKKKLFKISKPGVIYSGFVLVLFTTNAAFFIFANAMHKDDRIDSYIGLATDVILLACGIVVTVCCILFTIIQRNKFVRVVQNFYTISFEMAKLNEHIPYRNLLKHSRIHLVALFLVFCLLLLHTIFYVQGITTILYISYMCSWFVPKIYDFLMEYQFISGALLLKMHFSLLNKCLMKFDDFGKNDPGQKMFEIGISNSWVDGGADTQMNKVVAQTFTVLEGNLSKFRTRKIWSSENMMAPSLAFLEKIKVIRKIHSNLCEIKEYLNATFSLQLLTSVAQAFIYITANLYKIFTTLSAPSKTSGFMISYPIIWSVTHTIELVIIVVTCTNTSKTANHTAVLVHKLLAKECPPSLRNQLKLFSIQLLHRKISFTASGFFTLDMTLLQSIIGAATTYLVILIQFHNTYEAQSDL